MASANDYLPLAHKILALRHKDTAFPQAYFPQRRAQRPKNNDDAEVITLVLSALDQMGDSQFFEEGNEAT